MPVGVLFHLEKYGIDSVC